MAASAGQGVRKRHTSPCNTCNAIRVMSLWTIATTVNQHRPPSAIAARGPIRFSRREDGGARSEGNGLALGARMMTTDNTMQFQDGASACCQAPRSASSFRRAGPVPLTALLFVVVAGSYACYERIGTVANADLVEFTPDLHGGFLAIGMTDAQPGFVLLSALDRDQVEVNAGLLTSPLAGTHTVVEIQTTSATLRHRLRGPQIILIDEKGVIRAHAVDWTLEEFDTLRKAADCSFEAASKKRRCGAPFMDLHEAFAKWPTDRIPHAVRIFLKPFENSRTRRTEH